MSEDTYIGIDPGASGATVILYPDMPVTIIRHDVTPHEYADCVPCLRERHHVFALIERVSASRRILRGPDGKIRLDKNGKPKTATEGAASAFNFGQDFGIRIGILTALGVPHEFIQPAKWQREFGLTRKPRETQTQKKNRHKARAEQLFPSIQVTHRNADALLIAEYCRRVRQGVTA